MLRSRSVVAGALALAVLATGTMLPSSAAASPAPGRDVPTAADPAPTSRVDAALELLPLWTSSDRRIVDSAGRDVLLRGANVNSYGEYWQGDPTEVPTLPVTGADWDLMAAHGFSVVRLLVSWSRIEPQRGEIDQGYIDEVDAAVREAAARGIYVVIDMHQDAYTAFVSTTDPASCPPGTSPAKGWDGAPAWAVITDGLSTCTPGERNASPAIQAAWRNFYDDTAGIRGRFVEAWRALAARFAGRPEVAGYDLLNEPESPRPAAEMTPLYEELLRLVIEAIRSAEAGASFDHLVFVEPALPAADPSKGLVIPDPERAGVGTEGIVASVHNYSESIGIAGIPLTIEGTNDLIESLTAELGVAHWGGEYGFWDTSEETLAKARRYAADEDAHLWGGAWWQWRQACGDPHGVGWDGSAFVAGTGTSTHLNLLGCPGNVDLGPNHAFLDILGRAYPRATPGRLRTLASDPATGRLDITATAAAADVGEQIVVWTPTDADAEHRVSTRGLDDLTEVVVPGGRILTGTVRDAGDYALRIGGEPLVEEEGPGPDGPPVPEAPAAGPITAPASFTG